MKSFKVLSLLISVLSAAVMTGMTLFPEMVKMLELNLLFSLSIATLLIAVLWLLDEKNNKEQTILLFIVLVFVVISLALLGISFLYPEMAIKIGVPAFSVLSSMGSVFGLILLLDASVTEEDAGLGTI